MTTQNSAMGDDIPERFKLYLSAKAMRDDDRSMPYIAKKLGFKNASSIDSLFKRYAWTEVYAQQIALAADIDARKGMGSRLNKAIFFSTTQPGGQFVKDCIIAELDAANKDHEKLLRQAQNKEK